MSRRNFSFGVSTFGYAFGEVQQVASTASHYVDDTNEVLQWGCNSYYRAPDDVSAIDLATKAAKEAITNAKIKAKDIDLVVLATSDMPEYLYWDSSLALARELRIERIQSMLLNNEGCGSGSKAFAQIAGVFATQPEIQKALLVVVNRVSEFHRNRMTLMNAVLSDGAVAVILDRDEIANRWLATEHIAYPEFCDFFRSDYGGAKFPSPPERCSNVHEPGYHKIHQHFSDDLVKMQFFLKEQRNVWLIEIIQRACARANISKKDISHLIYINDARPGAIEAVAAKLNIPVERTNYKFSITQGHMGAADQIISLGQHIENGDVATNDIVAICGISTGMQWVCSLFRI